MTHVERVCCMQPTGGVDQDLTTLARMRGRLHVPTFSSLTSSWGSGDFCYSASPLDKCLIAVGVGWGAGDVSGGQRVDGTDKPLGSRPTPITSLPGHSNGVVVVTQSPVAPANSDSPTLLATGDTGGSVGIWCVKGRDVLGRAFFKVHAASVTA